MNSMGNAVPSLTWGQEEQEELEEYNKQCPHRETHSVLLINKWKWKKWKQIPIQKERG